LWLHITIILRLFERNSTWKIRYKEDPLNTAQLAGGMKAVRRKAKKNLPNGLRIDITAAWE